MRSILTRFLTNESANVAITFAVLSIPVMAGVGVIVDYTRLYNVKSDLQEVVDASALAGAGADDGMEISDAQSYFESLTDIASQPDISYDGVRVTVAVKNEVPLLILGNMRKKSSSVEVTATAIKGQENSACIYVLDSMQNAAFNANISGTLNAGCGVQINSSSSEALRLVNSGTINVPSTSVVGSYNVNSSGTENANISANQPAQPDPLAGLQMPSQDGAPCDYTNTTIISASPVTLSEGVYCGGLSINSSSNVTMESGTYVFRNGDFNINLSGSLSGDEILLYFEDDNSVFSTNQSGSISLSAKSSGTYKGILVFQSPNSKNPSKPYNLNLSGNIAYNGAIYVPDADLKWNISGSNSVPYQTPLITKTIDLNMSGTAS